MRVSTAVVVFLIVMILPATLQPHPALTCSVLRCSYSRDLQVCSCYAVDLPASGWRCRPGLDTVKGNCMVCAVGVACVVGVACLVAAMAIMFVAMVIKLS